MKSRTVVLMLFLVVLALPVGASAQGGKPTSSQRAAAAAAGEAVIMRMMYGNYDPRTKTSLWAKPSKAALEMLGQPAPYYSTMVGHFPFQEDGAKKVMFVTASTPRNFDCHGCAPVISVAVFSQDAGKWKLEATEGALTNSGAWGKPGQFKMEQMGPENYALVINSGFTAQGETSETAFFYARDGAKCKQILALDIHRDNGGACVGGGQACYDFSSSYEFKPGGSGPYYNLILTSSGTQLNDKGRVAPVKKKQIYVFKKGEYVVGP